MLPVLNIGPLAVPTTPLLILAGFWIGLEWMERHAPRFGGDPGQLYKLALIAILSGLAGARLVYAALAPEAFLASPLNLLSPRPEMLHAGGGLAAAALAAGIFIAVKHMPVWRTLDALTTLFSIFAVTLGLAHLASGAAFGAPSQVPWAIDLWGERRHPAQVYETLAAMLAAAAVWPGRAAADLSAEPGKAGLRFWLFLALSAAARFFLETFRGDSILLLGAFRQAQVMAWLVMAVSLWQIGVRLRDQQPPVRADLTQAGEAGK